jgi:hypothetical protein
MRQGPDLTRRKLLALLGSAPAVLSGRPGASPSAITSNDPIAFCWWRLDLALALQACWIEERDRLERELNERIGYPHVQLPSSTDTPPVFAADPQTTSRAPGLRRRSRHRLKHELRARQAAWDAAASECGLMKAIAQEEQAAEEVRQARDALFDMPAASLAALRIKLAVLLATAPGLLDRQSSPWNEIGMILADLDRLSSSWGSP